MTPDETRRRHPFVTGQRYIVRQTFTGCDEAQFVAGDGYEFVGARDDVERSRTVFTFRSTITSLPASWEWPDDEHDSLCWERFIVVDDVDS
jgi:hypothetical protein